LGGGMVPFKGVEDARCVPHRASAAVAAASPSVAVSSPAGNFPNYPTGVALRRVGRMWDVSRKVSTAKGGHDG
jgi:hypothetical protein